MLFSHAGLLLHGVSSDPVEIARTFSPREGRVFFKAVSHALLFFYSEAYQKRSDVQFVECISEVINPSLWKGLD